MLKLSVKMLDLKLACWKKVAYIHLYFNIKMIGPAQMGLAYPLICIQSGDILL